MKKVLIICGKIQVINSLRKFFDDNYSITATGTEQSGLFMAESGKPDFIVYYAGSDIKPLFGFYRDLRGNRSASGLPLLIIADAEVTESLSGMVRLDNTTIINAAMPREEMRKIFEEM